MQAEGYQARGASAPAAKAATSSCSSGAPSPKSRRAAHSSFSFDAGPRRTSTASSPPVATCHCAGNASPCAYSLCAASHAFSRAGPPVRKMKRTCRAVTCRKMMPLAAGGGRSGRLGFAWQKNLQERVGAVYECRQGARPQFCWRCRAVNDACCEQRISQCQRVWLQCTRDQRIGLCI